jgi:D-glycero-alpha-D-manno-heptose-7-phosphate kinase
LIISKTPFRVSFFGGGTDYPGWYRDNPGAVIATTINKYCYLNVRPLPPFFDYKTRILYSKVENVSSIDEIQHPAVRETLRFLNITDGLEIHHDGDLPARTGLGSSSTFTVGLLHALYALKGRMVSKMKLALEAMHIEQEMLKEAVGAQDQMLAACGGFNRIDFQGDAPIRISPVLATQKRLQELHGHLMLFFTGFTRIAGELAREQVAGIGSHKRDLQTMYNMVAEAGAILNGKPIEEFGKLLHESWTIKRGLSSRISTTAIDDIYERARKAGATGGKLLGAGGGGFMLIFAAPDRQAAVKEGLKGLLHVPFQFETLGSHIIHYDAE